MSGSRSIRGVAAWLAPCLGLLLAGCGQDMAPSGPAKVDPVAVRVTEAETVQRAATVTAAGVLRPNQRARMGTRQAGTVQAVLVQAGDHVTAGQEILRVDSRDLEASRAAALLQRDAAREAYEQALRNRERFTRLYAQELVAKVRLEEAQLQAERAASALRRAEAELAAVEVNLDYARLRAPFDGVVSEVLAETGSFVAPGMPLVVLEDRERLEVEASIDQASIVGLAAGDRLAVVVKGIDEPAEGRLQAVLPALAGSGTGLRLRVVIDDPSPELVPGMVAGLQVPSVRTAPRLVRVPVSALLRRGQLTGLFVIAADDDEAWRAQLRWVALEPGPPGDEWVYVKNGLAPGERVAYGTTIHELADGQAVTLRD